MKIKKMTATFGGLERATLEPGDGLTIISAPNEAGKSTWAAFLRAMLYGINTRERDKEGYLAEKNRYAPWSGAPMEGELLLEWRGEEITLRRFPKRTSPFAGFEAVYTASGDPVPGLTADHAGELLIGAGRELYERSAFVGQGSTVIGGSTELERRITALATTGDEEVSFTESLRTLKDWLNRRRANRSNGILPALDAQISETRAALESVEQTRREAESARLRLNELEAERKRLEGDMETFRRIAQQERSLRYENAKKDWGHAVRAIPPTNQHPLFGSMTAEEAWSYAQTQVEKQRAAEEENRKRAVQRADLERKKTRSRKFFAVWMFLLIAALSALVLCAVWSKWMGTVLFGVMTLAAAWGLFRIYRQQNQSAEEINAFLPVPIPDSGDILEQAAAYRESLAKAEQAKAAADAAKRLMDELAAQGGRERTPAEKSQPDSFPTPVRSPAETLAALRRVEQELAQSQRIFDMARGKMNTLGNVDNLYSKLDSLLAERTERQREYDAISLAMEVLTAANDTLRQRFSPALNRQAGELFARLTGGEYAALGLSRTLDAAVTPAGQLLPRSALALSRGTVEQLYLAVRLAVCQMTLGGENAPPLLLDDALTNFDDRRMEQALNLLQELSAERQILLFTCHSRERAWAEKQNAPVTCIDLS